MLVMTHRIKLNEMKNLLSAHVLSCKYKINKCMHLEQIYKSLLKINMINNLTCV